MNYNWIILTFILCIVSSIPVILIKYLGDIKTNLSIVVPLIYILNGMLSLCYLFFNYKELNIFHKKSDFIIYSIIILLSLSILMYWPIFSLSLIDSPNPAYNQLIVNLNVIIIAILCYLLFNKPIKLLTFIGIIIVIFGISLILYSS